MKLEQSLQLAIQNIRSGHLTQEAQVKQSVIVPLLRALDWDETDPSEFITEFPVPPDGRVDYALCVGPTQNPLVFIEAKRLGNVDYRAEGQLFGYAVNRGVPFLILTDGNVWDFYLSMAPGEPSQRRFKHIDLKRDDLVADCAPFFEQYLRKNRVLSLDARMEAERLLQTDPQHSKILTLNEAYAIAKTPESEAKLVEVNRRVETRELAEGSRQNLLWQVKKHAVLAAGWQKTG